MYRNDYCDNYDPPSEQCTIHVNFVPVGSLVVAQYFPELSTNAIIMTPCGLTCANYKGNATLQGLNAFAWFLTEVSRVFRISHFSI